MTHYRPQALTLAEKEKVFMEEMNSPVMVQRPQYPQEYQMTSPNGSGEVHSNTKEGKFLPSSFKNKMNSNPYGNMEESKKPQI